MLLETTIILLGVHEGSVPGEVVEEANKKKEKNISKDYLSSKQGSTRTRFIIWL